MGTRFYKFLVLAGIALISIAGVRSANAATVSNAFIDLGTVAEYDEDTYTVGSFGNALISQISGSLPSNTMIKFTYTFSSALSQANLASGGSYSYTDLTDGLYYEGFAGALADLTSSSAYAAGAVEGNLTTSLAFASANIDGTMSAVAIIKNFSGSALEFMSLFVGSVTGDKPFDVKYEVSAVPLPAALPLFGFGVGALAYRSRKKRKAA